jgi:tetratricopeptide (TPR) repeat protein
MSDSSVDSGQLRRHIVRIDRADGKILGTGFFVALGWVLTCAHVVDGLRDVRLVPAGAQQPLDAVVAGSSTRRPDGSRSGIWPFPDLALLHFVPEDGHHYPCVLLDAHEPTQDRPCQAWGYPRREDEVDPVGSAITVNFQGIDGDRYLSLRAGEIHPGLSGAPLVCPDRRAVVGVVAATRDPRGDRGGWASPAAGLLAGPDVLPADFAAVAAEVWSRNRAAVLADRQSWNAVLPVPGAEQALDVTWSPFVRGSKSLPSQMLLADHTVVPYLFRDPDLARMRQWCNQADPIALAVVPGLGGGGKSRFAIELCRQMQADGWSAGFLRDPQQLISTPAPRLAIVDYAEAVSNLSDVLKVLRGSATDIAPLRILLLTRTSPRSRQTDPLDPLRREAVLQSLVDNSVDVSSAEISLTKEQRQVLFRDAVGRFARAWGLLPHTDDNDLSAGHFARPLEVLVEALNSVLATEDRDGARAAGTGMHLLLGHEERYWAVNAPSRLADENRRLAVALVTIAGASDRDGANDLLDLFEHLTVDRLAASDRRDIVAWLQGLYDGPDLLNPLRPDRLGEALIQEALDHLGNDGNRLLIGALNLSDAQVLHTLNVIARLPTSIGRQVIGALLSCYNDLVTRSEERAAGIPGRPGSDDLAVATARAHIGLLSDGTVLTLQPSQRGQLSANMDRLGSLLVNWGQVAMARAIFDQALLIDQELALAEPGNTSYQRGLSSSYDRLGDLAQAEGQSERARELYQQALDIGTRLAEAEPGNTTYQRDLSLSYDRLGDLAQAEGQSEQARELYQQALDIGTRLASAEPGNTTYQHDLSVSYDRLGDLARDEGQSEQARELYQQALDIRAELAGAEPANTTYQRDLAVSYAILGDLARAEGQSEQARELYQDALDIHSRLAKAEPGNTTYQHDLPFSYDRLATVNTGPGEQSNSIVSE